MYQVFIRANGKTSPATIKGLGERQYLAYEDQNEAKNQATNIRLAMAYLTNAGVKHGAEVLVREV